MRTRRVGRGLGVTAVTVVVALGAATACGTAGKSRAADPTTSTTSTTGPPPTTGPHPSASAEPTVPPPLGATDNGSLGGTWVADNGDVLDFVRTAPGTYHGTVLFASHCAPDAGPVVVSSQGPGRYVGTGPLESSGAGWCGAPDPVSPVTIVVASGGSTARVAAETWTRTTFAVHGNIPPPGPNDEDQAVGSPALAQTCDKSRFDSYQLHGSLIATSFKLGRAPSAAALLTHFLEGTGSAVDYPAGSAVAGEAASSPAFEQEDQRVQGYMVSRLNQGATRIDPGDGHDVLNTIDFADQSMRDLYLGFRNTQGITVTGVGTLVGSEYVGELTYVIQDAYGFGVHDYLLGAGAEMRYLQTTCGAPYYPGGAHWFPDSITVTVGLRVPVGAAG